MTGLTWYTNIRKKYFGNIFINPGIIEDQVEYAIWRLDIYRSSHHYKMLLYSVTNSIKTPLMISLKVWLPLLQFLKTSPVTLILSVEYSAAINVFFFNDEWSKRSPQNKCSVKNFHFTNQSNGWALNNGALDFRLFYLYCARLNV